MEVDDVADALAERIGRQGYLLQRDRQFVFVIEETGDFVFRGKTITDPALITELNQHIGKADDESTCGSRLAWRRFSGTPWTGTSRAGKAPASTPSPSCWPLRRHP